MFRNRWLIALTAIAAVLVLVTADAHARVGGGFSGGSRGMRTFSAPPATPIAPTAAPIQNSMTQPGSAAPIGQTAMRPGLFGGGLFSGIAAGFLGAGLFGMLFGHGLFVGMAGFASILGLLLQVMLIVIVARLIFVWWQRRNMPAPAYAAATGHSFGGLRGMLGGTDARPASEPLTVACSSSLHSARPICRRTPAPNPSALLGVVLFQYIANHLTFSKCLGLSIAASNRLCSSFPIFA
jgi:hypothetical protein